MSTRFYYLRSKKNLQRRADGTPTRGIPMAVIASTFDKATHTVKYGIAAIHKADSFVKELGRKIALGRLETAPFTITDAPETGHEITRAVMSDIVARYELSLPDQPGYRGKAQPGTIPQQVKELAAKWLRQAAKPKAEVFPAAKQA